MTRAQRGSVARPGPILSRLYVVLVLVLFGVPQSHAGGLVVHTGPAAESQVGQAKGVLTVQRLLLRGQISHDDAADTVATGAGVQVFHPRPAGTVSRAPHQTLFPLALRILPPVRGPPAA